MRLISTHPLPPLVLLPLLRTLLLHFLAGGEVQTAEGVAEGTVAGVKMEDILCD